MDQPNVVTQQREPWNKESSSARSLLSNSRRSGLFAYGFNSQIAPETLLFSTWPSTAS